MAKEKVPKERTPYCVGLRPLCALQLTAGAAELATLRQSSRYSALSLQCSTTQKGLEDQNKGQNLIGEDWYSFTNTHNFFRHTVECRYPEIVKEWFPARDMPERR